MLQLHLSDQQFYCILRYAYIRGLTVLQAYFGARYIEFLPCKQDHPEAPAPQMRCLVVSCGVVFFFFRYSKFTHVTETKVLSFWRGSSLVSLDDVSRQPPVCPVAGVASG